MYATLSPGAIGIRLGWLESLELARQAGFEAADLNPDEARSIGAAATEDAYASRGLRPGGWGLTLDWRGDEAAFRSGLPDLELQARIASAVGCTRCVTWVPSWHDRLSRRDYWRQATGRFAEVAKLLGDHGCRLGLEFLGPRTLRAGRPHGFIHTMDGMLALCHAIDRPNVGLLFDLWHWYAARETLDDLRHLSPEDLVYIHANDAPTGVDALDLVDNCRCLPGETGVIPAREALSILREIGCDCPVAAEPFNAALNELAAQDPAAAALRTRESLRSILP